MDYTCAFLVASTGRRFYLRGQYPYKRGHRFIPILIGYMARNNNLLLGAYFSWKGIHGQQEYQDNPKSSTIFR